jgi:hypothetical protein
MAKAMKIPKLETRPTLKANRLSMSMEIARRRTIVT